MKKESKTITNIVSGGGLTQLNNFVRLRQLTEQRETIHYSEQCGNDICELVANGVSIQEICKSDTFPCEATVYGWGSTYPDFFLKLQLARQRCADLLIAEAMEIADDSKGDIKTDEKGRTVIDWENVNRSKLRVETRKWYASKLAPKRYGDKLELSGEIALNTAELSITGRIERMRELVTEFENRGGKKSELLELIGFQEVKSNTR